MVLRGLQVISVDSGINVLLEYLPGRFGPAIVPPECYTVFVFTVDEDIAFRDIGIGKPGKAECDHGARQAMAAMGVRDRKMVKITAPAIVPAQHDTHDVAGLRGSNGAQPRVPLQKRADRRFSIGFIQPYPLGTLPEIDGARVVRRNHGTNVDV
jgi:hypothetical protein